RIFVAQPRRAAKYQTLWRAGLQQRGQALGVRIDGQLHVDVLVECRDSECERGTERHLGLRVKALRVEHRQLGSPEHSRHQADQIEVTLVRRTSGAGERDAVSLRLALLEI